MINAAVGRAMSATIDRVNTSPEALQRKVDDLTRVIERQAETIRQLRARLELYEQDALPEVAPVKPETITPKQAARKFHKSVATINRALNAGRLNGWQQPNGHWLVDANSPLISTRGKK